MSKTCSILRYLETHKRGITSLDAFEKFGATRLSSIIFELRKNYNIVSIRENGVDRYGNEIHYARYILRKEDK